VVAWRCSHISIYPPAWLLFDCYVTMLPPHQLNCRSRKLAASFCKLQTILQNVIQLHTAPEPPPLLNATHHLQTNPPQQKFCILVVKLLNTEMRKIHKIMFCHRNSEWKFLIEHRMITQNSYFLVENDEAILKIKKILFTKKSYTTSKKYTKFQFKSMSRNIPK